MGVAEPTTDHLIQAEHDIVAAFAEARTTRKFKDGYRIIKNDDGLHAIVSAARAIVTVISPALKCRGCPCIDCKAPRNARSPHLPRMGRRKDGR
jgi:hypothetical protein